eukprot:TRINITY_DN13769_c0_g2_i1.p1 TRINITY_DN13769_c0_g2~~TRINITY_DN13769_c0_g2_i1.p1  ORF type:complete len:375 (+),score=72.27 TRINITY_DN13769_c0_g2_i1:116-1126(+)
MMVPQPVMGPGMMMPIPAGMIMIPQPLGPNLFMALPPAGINMMMPLPPPVMMGHPGLGPGAGAGVGGEDANYNGGGWGGGDDDNDDAPWNQFHEEQWHDVDFTPITNNRYVLSVILGKIPLLDAAPLQRVCSLWKGIIVQRLEAREENQLKRSILGDPSSRTWVITAEVEKCPPVTWFVIAPSRAHVIKAVLHYPERFTHNYIRLVSSIISQAAEADNDMEQHNYGNRPLPARDGRRRISEATIQAMWRVYDAMDHDDAPHWAQNNPNINNDDRTRSPSFISHFDWDKSDLLAALRLFPVDSFSECIRLGRVMQGNVISIEPLQQKNVYDASNMIV